VVSFTPRPLYPQGKSFRYASGRRLGGPHSRSGRGGEVNERHIRMVFDIADIASRTTGTRGRVGGSEKLKKSFINTIQEDHGRDVNNTFLV
jgi:hypothetical protein